MRDQYVNRLGISVFEADRQRRIAIGVIKDEINFMETEDLVDIADALDSGHYLTTDYT